MIRLNLFLILLFFGLQGYSQVIEPLDPKEISIPKKLYTWVSFKRVEAQLDGLASGKNILQPINPDYNVAKVNPKLAGVPGKFAWIDPLTGVASTPEEIYGRGEVLMEMEIDLKKIKSAYLVEALVTEQTNDVDIKGAIKSDIILFQMYERSDRTGEVRLAYQEWIILNQEIIKKSTVNPEVLIPLIKKKLSLLNRKNRQYPIEQIHNVRADLPNSDAGKAFVSGLMNKYINDHAPQITELLKIRSSRASSCQQFFRNTFAN